VQLIVKHRVFDVDRSVINR